MNIFLANRLLIILVFVFTNNIVYADSYKVIHRLPFTIQDAINDAEDGDTVMVYDGIYTS